MSGNGFKLTGFNGIIAEAGYNPLAAHEARRQHAKLAKEHQVIPEIETAAVAFCEEFTPKEYQPTDEAGNPLPFYEEAS